MTDQQRSAVMVAGENFFGSPRFSSALTLAIVGTELAALFVRDLMGWPGLIGVLSGLVILAVLSLIANMKTIEWHGLLPISLLVFVGWSAVSIFWSQYQWATLAGVLYLGVTTMLGIYIALVRDTIQIARAFGDIFRVALALSLALEIVAGVLIDSPIHFLHINGALTSFGPLQGIFGGRNALGVIALLALVTFGIELRTKSLRRGISIGSLILGGLCLLLARSPIAAGGLVIVALAALALYGLRRVAASRRRFWQFGLLVVAIIVTVVAWILRTPIINALSASAELNQRLAIWRQIRLLIPQNSLQGWGWIGLWRNDIGPFFNFSETTPTSALNAYLDVWFQVGFVGLCLFVGMLAVTFVRSWLLAARQRSVVFAWPALMLVVLITTATAESTLLVEFGWLTFVVCCVKASRELSWRKAFAATDLERSEAPD